MLVYVRVCVHCFFLGGGGGVAIDINTDKYYKQVLIHMYVPPLPPFVYLH